MTTKKKKELAVLAKRIEEKLDDAWESIDVALEDLGELMERSGLLDAVGALPQERQRNPKTRGSRK